MGVKILFIIRNSYGFIPMGSLPCSIFLSNVLFFLVNLSNTMLCAIVESALLVFTELNLLQIEAVNLFFLCLNHYGKFACFLVLFSIELTVSLSIFKGYRNFNFLISDMLSINVFIFISVFVKGYFGYVAGILFA